VGEQAAPTFPEKPGGVGGNHYARQTAVVFTYRHDFAILVFTTLALGQIVFA